MYSGIRKRRFQSEQLTVGVDLDPCLCCPSASELSYSWAPGAGCDGWRGDRYLLSLIMPAYNEVGSLRTTVLQLLEKLDQDGIAFELLLVDNGSEDGTGDVIEELRALDCRIRAVKVPVNRGFGWGVLSGLREASGNTFGYLASDGQVAPEDVVRVYREFISHSPDIAKVWREVRRDGRLRKLQSLGFNFLMRLCFGTRSWDINGSPKIMDRQTLKKLSPVSRDWFLDAEIMIKAHRLGLSVSEVPICFREREAGESNISMMAVIEFLKDILRYRFGKELESWSESL